VSTQRRAEEQLSSQFIFVQNLLDVIPNPVWHKNRDGVVTWCNRAFEEYFGVPRGEFIGLRHDMITEDGCNGHCSEDRELLERGGSTAYECEVRTASCRVRHALVSKVALKEDDGSSGGIVGVITDITAQKASEAELKKVEERWNLALSGSGDGVYDWDIKTGRVYLSPRWKEIIGYRDDEIGDGVEEWETRLHPDDVGWVSEELRKHLDGESDSYETEHRLLCKDGSYRWILDRGKVTLREPDGTPVRMVGTHTDVTERRGMQETSERQAREFATLLDSLPGFAFYKNDRLEYITANRTFCDALGVSREDIVGKSDADLFPAQLTERYGNGDKPVLSGTIPVFEVEEEEMTRGGRRITLSMRKVPVKDNDGRTVGLIGLGFDVSRQKAVEEDLRKFIRAIEQTPASIVITDTEGSIEYVNPKFTAITGYSAEEARGKNPRILKSNELSPEVYKTLWDTIKAGEVWHGEFHNKKKDGGLYWEMASVSPVIGQSGDITHFIAVKEDITERKRVEESLKTAKTELEAVNAQLQSSIKRANQLAIEAQSANVAKSRFLANMSHELRTPLNGVLGMVGFLLDSPLTDEQREFARVVQSSARSLLTIVNDVLDYSRMGSRKVTLESGDFDPARVVQEAIDTLAVSAREGGNEVSCVLGPSLPALLVGDAARLRQVLVNILGNAIKFTHGGKIIVGCVVQRMDRYQATLRFDISDTGIGIAGEKMDRLFKPFSQVDPSAERRYGGTGLGLTIAKQLTKMMGGEIGVESEEDKGSTFWFTAVFGRRLEGEKERHSGRTLALWPPLGPEDLPARAKGTRILVAEDHPMNQKIVLRMLRNAGYGADIAANGKEVLAMLEERTYDLLFMDVQMPQLDGLKTTSIIRENEKRTGGHIPIVAMTAHTMEEDRRLCIDAGMDDYLSKPLDIEIMTETIRRWLGDGTRAEEDGAAQRVVPETGERGGKATAGEKSPSDQPAGMEHEKEIRSADEVFDRQNLLRTLNGDEEFLRELVGLFLGEIPDQVKIMQRLSDVGDAEGVAELAHKLKGSSANIRAGALRRLFADIEGSAKRAELNEIAPFLDRFDYEINEFRRACGASSHQEPAP
jgi:two-component system, sensor histidine kinase and response regulator